jgi:hypothetical protein
LSRESHNGSEVGYIPLRGPKRQPVLPTRAVALRTIERHRHLQQARSAAGESPRRSRCHHRDDRPASCTTPKSSASKAHRARCPSARPGSSTATRCRGSAPDPRRAACLRRARGTRPPRDERALGPARRGSSGQIGDSSRCPAISARCRQDRPTIRTARIEGVEERGCNQRVTVSRG